MELILVAFLCCCIALPVMSYLMAQTIKFPGNTKAAAPGPLTDAANEPFELHVNYQLVYLSFFYHFFNKGPFKS